MTIIVQDGRALSPYTNTKPWPPPAPPSVQMKTPKELAAVVRRSMMQSFNGQPEPVQAGIKESHESLTELEQLAIEGTTKEPLETRVARLEASVLPPAESCAEAVERFREALELLAKRHAVEVEVGSIDPGSCCAGITDLDVGGLIDQQCTDMQKLSDEKKELERERAAWDKIEAWIDRATDGSRRGSEFRKPKRPHRLSACVFVLAQMDGLAPTIRQPGVNGGQWQSKTFPGVNRLAALEAAAAWCEGQK